MCDDSIGSPAAPFGKAAAPGGTGKFLFSPVVDFFCLGGVTFLILPILLLTPDSKRASVFGAALALSFAINNPHFANSYQLFYRNFSRKAFGTELPRGLRLRYIFAGHIVPLGLAILLGFGLMQPDTRLLGYSANLMTLLVGWHYAKQGYGILMVDCALKKNFFSDREKLVFRMNALACWIVFWLLSNRAGIYENLFGIRSYSFHIPGAIFYIAATGALATSVAALGLLALRDLSKLPFNGVMAYLVTIYIWFFGQLSPMMLIVIPALHSLQYLVVVWRYEMNREKAAGSPFRNFFVFVAVGVALGYLGFAGLPEVLSKHIAFRPEIFGTLLPYFVFTIFINVHHYFMDNVMWRRENPDMRAYLFAPRSP